MSKQVMTLLLLLGTSTAVAQDRLQVPGYADAAIVVPPASERPLPLVIGLHGNFDRPEWMCGAWAQVVRGRAFLLCPRGLPRNDAPRGADRWTHRPVPQLLREVAAARAALVARYPGRVDEGPDIWIGFSLGAHRVAAMASREPDRFPLIQLVEGGDSLLVEGGAARYARTRGRAAIVCAQRGCERRATRLVSELERAQARGRVETISTCHACLDVQMPAIVRTFDWLIEGNPRFAR